MHYRSSLYTHQKIGSAFTMRVTDILLMGCAFLVRVSMRTEIKCLTNKFTGNISIFRIVEIPSLGYKLDYFLFIHLNWNDVIVSSYSKMASSLETPTFERVWLFKCVVLLLVCTIQYGSRLVEPIHCRYFAIYGNMFIHWQYITSSLPYKAIVIMQTIERLYHTI